MREPITMPQLGETVTEGTVIRWLRQQGDQVAVDEPLLEIQTDKVAMEVPSLRAGVLVEIVVQDGQTVPVGAALAWLETGEDTGDTTPAPPLPAAAVVAAEATAPPVASAPTAAPAEPRGGEEGGGGARPSPLIRRLLAEAGLTAEQVTGTGPGGKIRREDVADAVAQRDSPSTSAPAPAPSPTPAPAVAPAPSRRAAGDAPGLSVAAGTAVVEVDATRIAETGRRGRLPLMSLLARAAVETLHELPDLTGTGPTGAVHLGIATDVDGRTVEGVVRDADRLSMAGLAAAIAELPARAGSAGGDQGPTLTLVDSGGRHLLFEVPVLGAQQAVVIAAGAVQRRPAVVTDADGSEGVAIRSMMYLAMAYDRSAVDGALAAALLDGMRSRLESRRFADEVAPRKD